MHLLFQVSAKLDLPSSFLLKDPLFRIGLLATTLSPLDFGFVSEHLLIDFLRGKYGRRQNYRGHLGWACFGFFHDSKLWHAFLEGFRGYISTFSTVVRTPDQPKFQGSDSTGQVTCVKTQVMHPDFCRGRILSSLYQSHLCFDAPRGCCFVKFFS